jgi:hypothetical protein
MKQDDYPEEIQELLIFKGRTPPGPKGDDYAAELENDTLPKELEQVKKLPKSCEDCGKMVAGRRLNIKRNIQPVLYWRKQCSICNLCEHPVTKEYSLTQQELRSTVRKLYVEPTLDPTKGRPKAAVSKVKIDNNDK